MWGRSKFFKEKVRLVPGIGKFLLAFCGILMCGTNTFSQDRCGIIQYNNIRQERKLLREDDRKFEQWITKKMSDTRGRLSTASTTLKIPVVVHVVHNGEAVGTGLNIPDAQIISQIKVLNNDFRRLNKDTVNTPAEFSSLASGFNIEFVLAKQTPNGTVSNGIVRVKGTKTQWSIDDDTTLKALSYWPAEDYLNIWVTDISSSILGYSQFPVSDLAGLEDAEDNRLTDGVVLDYRIVGSNDDGSFNLTSNFNKGRTATHEVGHFFGLRHIWGDDDGLCSGSDYVDDTPNQGNSTNGCPSNPQTSCNAHSMFQNYMDYTNDVCMNLYTKKQVDRMITVLENSPRRASLLTSEGLYDPAPVANDLAIKEILNPSSSECTGLVVPTITIENKGSTRVTSTRIQLTVNSKIIETKDFLLNSLETLESADVSFSPLELSAGNDTIYFQIVNTNSGADGKTNDNLKTVMTAVPQLIAVPFVEKFDIMPSGWTITNADKGLTWAITAAGTMNNTSNNALAIEYYGVNLTGGEKDILITPVVDLSNATSPYLSFDVAYAKYKTFSDGLEVYVLLNCNTELSSTSRIYSKYGSSLSTATATGSFSPSQDDQWRREVIDLSAYIGQPNVQFAFVAINDNGNNLFIDNVAFRNDVSEDVAIKEATNFSPVQCDNQLKPSLLVENKGIVPIQSFKIRYAVNNGTAQTMSVSENFNLAAGQQSVVELPSISLQSGLNSISYELIEPNGFIDIKPGDNKMQIKSVVNNDSDVIPLRKNFDSDESGSSWQIINPTGSQNWETTSTNYSQSLYFNGYDSESTSSDQLWFVSPVLDFTNAGKASLFFDLSFRYGKMDSTKDPGETVFEILASRDCGNSFDEVLLSSNEISLSSGSTDEKWEPSHVEEWTKKFINLNSLAGAENVRIAFVIKQTISNSLYVDNIEFFVSDNPSPFTPSDLYRVYGDGTPGAKDFYVTFNLPERQVVAYELVDMLGRTVGTKELTDVLNQTYKVDVDNASNGIYLVRLLIDKQYYVSRIFVGQ